MKNYLIAMAAMASSLYSYSKPVDNKTVTNVDLHRYMGLWYEIARYDTSFENAMDHVTATYKLMPDGHISVVNQGFKNGKLKVSHGRGKLPDPSQPAKLKVAFFLWFYADYFILELDELNYDYALVGSSSSNYLWILSRTPTMSNRDLNFLLRSAKTRGYDINKLVYCDQRPLKTTSKTSSHYASTSL